MNKHYSLQGIGVALARRIFGALLALSLLTRAAPGMAAGATNSVSGAADDSDSLRLSVQDKLYYRNDQDPIDGGAEAAKAGLIVNSRGMLEVPVSRGFDLRINVKAAGRTVGEVKREIKQKLEDEFYRTANITLTLESLSAKPGLVIFYGEVKGSLPLTAGQPKYLSEAILEMKPNEYANLKKVKLIRTDSTTKTNITRYINVDAILSKGKKEDDVLLEDGDTVNISAKWLNF
jgi:protein involved in polysaccharide export with SLBB domain